jgi:hypothetical protein
MTRLTPALDVALSQDRPFMYGSVEINLPGYDLRLLDGSGVLQVDGQSFFGEDPIYGVLESIDELDDGLGDEAPGISVNLLPASEAAAGQLSSPTFQGARVRIRVGAVDRATGYSVGSELLFDGEIDVPTLTIGKSRRALSFECVSSFERFFDNDEGARLSDSFHQSIWPGETGFANITGVEQTIYWGVASPSGANLVKFGGSSGQTLR